MGHNTSTCTLAKGAAQLVLALALGAIALAAHSAPITTQGTWWGIDGTLQARDIDGNAMLPFARLECLSFRVSRICSHPEASVRTAISVGSHTQEVQP